MYHQDVAAICFAFQLLRHYRRLSEIGATSQSLQWRRDEVFRILINSTAKHTSKILRAIRVMTTIRR